METNSQQTSWTTALSTLTSTVLAFLSGALAVVALRERAGVTVDEVIGVSVAVATMSVLFIWRTRRARAAAFSGLRASYEHRLHYLRLGGMIDVGGLALIAVVLFATRSHHQTAQRLTAMVAIAALIGADLLYRQWRTAQLRRALKSLDKSPPRGLS